MQKQPIFKKTAIIYLFVMFFCIVFNYVYSYFGHGVISNSMRFAFLYPLILGVEVYFVLYGFGTYERISYNLYNAGLATLILGSLYQGVIDVAGADTTYAIYYFILGIPLILAAVFLNVLATTKKQP